jgi:hypothetical protein
MSSKPTPEESDRFFSFIESVLGVKLTHREVLLIENLEVSISPVPV